LYNSVFYNSVFTTLFSGSAGESFTFVLDPLDGLERSAAAAAAAEQLQAARQRLLLLLLPLRPPLGAHLLQVPTTSGVDFSYIFSEKNSAEIFPQISYWDFWFENKPSANPGYFSPRRPGKVGFVRFEKKSIFFYFTYKTTYSLGTKQAFFNSEKIGLATRTIDSKKEERNFTVQPVCSEHSWKF
jgi:hypothetical protein